jgi:hypothetical protein
MKIPETTAGLVEMLNIERGSDGDRLIHGFFSEVSARAKQDKLQELADKGVALPEEEVADIDMEDGNLVMHARRELEVVGLLSDDSDYDGMLGESVLRLVKEFSHQGHSGASAHMTLDIFDRVAHLKPLGPLTNNPGEWNCIAEHGDGTPMWQSSRQSDAFSEDGGKTYYTLGESMGVYGCPDCDGGFETHTHPIEIDPKEDVCGEHGKLYVVKREGKPDLRHTSAEAK